MSLVQIATLKEFAQGYQPLVLIEINFGDRAPLLITGASNAGPIVVTIANHPYSTGSIVAIQGVLGNTAANGIWTVTKLSANTFSLNGSTGNAAYVSGGTATNSTMLFLSSHMNSASGDGGGGFPYQGRDYLPRLLNQDQLITQALSDQGIDRVPQLTITVSDPSRSIYASYETAIGFKGATMTARFVFWQAGTSNFSLDAYVPFVGICQQAAAPDDGTLTLTAVSKFQMNQISFPILHVQPSCVWSFPATPAQRRDGAGNTFSPNYGCGYSPDGGTNLAGNFQATSTLGALINSVQTSITVGSVTGTLSATPFIAIIDGAASGAMNEAVVVTNVSGSTWTITRAAQGTYGIAAPISTNVWVPYSSCDKTRASCMQRMGNISDTSLSPDGNITRDTSNRGTGRFSGIQWQPASSLVSRGYISGKWELIINNSNQAKYGDLVPLAYGTTWINALVLDTYGDANYTNMDVLICSGQVPYIYDVIVNGVRIPHSNGPSTPDTIMPSVPNELPPDNNIGGGFWGAMNDGGRNGHIVAGSPKHRDPFGGLCVISITVPVMLASANSTPSVQVRFDGPALQVYSNVNTVALQYSSNPAWVLMDLLFKSGWTPNELNIQSFIDTAAWCATQINFTNKASVVTNTIMSDRPGVGLIPYVRNDVSLGQRQPVSAADLIRGIRNNCRALLLPNAAGLLTLLPKATLADQQPSIPTLNGQTATNDVSPVASVKFDGTSGNGYVAYFFDERTIALKEGSKTETTFKILTRTLADSPNSVGVTFQDAENQYNQDSVTVVDTEDTARIQGQQVQGSFIVSGLNTFDRAQRPINTFMAENLRGNLRNSADAQTIGDTGGTVKIEFETSFRGIHLTVGNIIMVSNQIYGITTWLFRITGIQPGANASRIKIQASYHNDAWYLDTFGQANAPLYQRPQSGGRVPYSWSPGLEAPMPGDSMFLVTEKSYRLSQKYTTAADNTSVCRPLIEGYTPINVSGTSPQPPVISLQATTSSTGGTIPGGRTYFIGVSAKDVTGVTYKPSQLSSRIAVVNVPAGTNTNTITVDIVYWDPSAAGYVIFAGNSSQKLTYQTDADFSGAPPSTVTFTAYKEADLPAPDQYFSSVRFYTFNQTIGGPIGFEVVSATSTTIKVQMLAGAGMPANQYANYDISLYGMVAVPSNGQPGQNKPNQNPLPIFNAKIASNTGDTFTLTTGLDGNIPNPTTIPRGDGTFGLIQGDLFLIRSKPTVGSDSIGNYLDDPNFEVKCARGIAGEFYSPVVVSACTNANPGVITSATPHGLTTGMRAYLQNMNGMTGFPLLVQVTVTDATHFSIGVNTTSSGAYTSGGFLQRLASGIDPGEVTNAFILFISGSARGTLAMVASATASRIYVNGAWPTTPDSTSRYVVLNSLPEPQLTTPNISNIDFKQISSMQLSVNNISSYSVGFLAVTVDQDGNEALHFNSPYRDCFIVGSPGNLAVAGGMAITVDGTLAIGSNQGPISIFNAATTPIVVRVDLKQAPTGADLTVQFVVASVVVLTLVVPAGATSVLATSSQLSAMGSIPAVTNVEIDITTVGTTFPGSDLTANIFY